MQKYINQLVEDLEEAAQDPPKASFIEPPPHIEDDQVISELALVPFKTIEELTGIKHEVFPEMDDLRGGQWEQVNKAILKVFDSLNIELVDIPSGIPPEWLYEVLTTNWQQEVQYLPSSGMDLELCTGDPMTCPYGDYCNCDEEWVDDEDEIPEHFEKVVPQIADAIDAGLVCYLDPQTMEIEEIPEMLLNEPDEYEAITGLSPEGERFKHKTWSKYYVFEPLESFEYFKIMESFADELDESPLRDQLINALNRKKPFANFKAVIDNSEQRQNWFDFKKNWVEQHVRKLIWDEINGLTDDFTNEINGFFNDDGTKIDPDSVPVPNLCIICKHHLDDDWEENMLCLLNRNDQRNDDDFKCGMFEKI